MGARGRRVASALRSVYLTLLGAFAIAGRSSLDEIRDDFRTRALTLISTLQEEYVLDAHTVSLTAFEDEHGGQPALPFSYRDRYGVLYVCSALEDPEPAGSEGRVTSDGFVTWDAPGAGGRPQAVKKDAAAGRKAAKKAAAKAWRKETAEQGARGPGKDWHAALEGICSTFRNGWWTFEWCHKRQVMQYHLNPSTGVRDPVWSLGSYSGTKGPTQERDAGMALSEIHDTFAGGQLCDETGAPRSTKVLFRCCSEHEHLLGSRLGHAEYKRGTVAHILGVREPNLCEYEVIVCAAPLCEHQHPAPGPAGEGAAEEGGGDAGRRAARGTAAAAARLRSMTPNQILKDVLGDVCLQRNEGWWTYEICDGTAARQFHLVSEQDASGKSIIKVETEYSLGELPPGGDGNIPGELTTIFGSDSDEGLTALRVELSTGTECDLNGKKRATTVEFLCSESNRLISVVEDHTCHYRMRVSLSALCDHEKFIKPEHRTTQVSCEPVLEDGGAA